MYKETRISKDLDQTNNPVIKNRLLMARASFKKPLRDVAFDFDCTHGTVAYWKNRYIKYGIEGMNTKERSGRPKKISKKQEIKIKNKVMKYNNKNGWRTKHIRALIKEDAGVVYSERHVIRIAQSWGLSQQKPRSRYIYSKKEDRNSFIKKTKISSENSL